MKRPISPTVLSGLAAAGLVLATLSLGASPSFAEPGSSNHIGMGAKTCVPAPDANCSKVKHRWKFEHHGDLSGASFTKAHLHGAKLHDATLRKANFSKAKLHKAKFHRANLNKAVFDGAGMKGAEFNGAKLQGTSFVSANLKGTDFGALSSPRFASTRTSSAEDCYRGTDIDPDELICRATYLVNADFSDSNLQGADFHFANLEGANFSGSNLQGANFIGANLKDVNFDGADLTGAFLSGVVATGASFNNVTADSANFSYADIVGVSVSGARMPNTNFYNACAWDIDTDVSNGVDLSDAWLSKTEYYPWALTASLGERCGSIVHGQRGGL